MNRLVTLVLSNFLCFRLTAPVLILLVMEARRCTRLYECLHLFHLINFECSDSSLIIFIYSVRIAYFDSIDRTRVSCTYQTYVREHGRWDMRVVSIANMHVIVMWLLLLHDLLVGPFVRSFFHHGLFLRVVVCFYRNPSVVVDRSLVRHLFTLFYQ